MSRRDRQPGALRGRIVALAGFAATAGLALLHGQLLFQRVADGSLLEPSVAARWLASALVAAAMLRFWSRGLPLLHGRRALVLWLVVLLIHLGAPGSALPAIPPAAPVLLAMPATLALIALLGVRAAAGRPRGAPGLSGRIAPCGHRPPAASGRFPRLYSRPPPVALGC